MKTLVKTLEAQVIESEQSADEVGEQRSRNHRYYSLQPIGNEVAGRSHYISPDVMDSVESKKAIFTETFFSGRQTVRFRAEGNQDAMSAAVRTAYCNKQLAMNDHFSLFRDGWHDAFVAKRMVIVAEWYEDEATLDIELEGATDQQAMAIIRQHTQNDRVTGMDDANVQMANGMISGTLGVKVDRSRVKLTLIHPEKYHRDPHADYVSKGVFAGYEAESSRGQLIEDGYDEEQVMGLKQEYRFRHGEEDSARKAHDSSFSGIRRGTRRVDEQETITHYKTWTWLDLGEETIEDATFKPGYRLYRICWAQGEILRYADGKPAIMEVDEIPAFEWTEYKIAHADHGMADADVLAHTQKTQSTLKRLIIDNQQMRNTSRYEALHGALMNPRDLLDNKIGGVVWTRQIGSVAPLTTPELSPLTFQVIDMLKRDAEARSGMSELAKGMNPDALRYQNAADMVERLTNAGNKRIMRAARDFANTFMVPLCKYIVSLGIRNDERIHQLEAQGQQANVVMTQMPDIEMDMQVAVALTPDEGVRFAQTLMMVDSAWTNPQAPKTVSQLYGIKQQHQLWDDVLEALGIADSSRYLMRPDSPEFLQQSQMQQQMQQAMQQKQEALQMQQMEFQKWLAQSSEGRAWWEAQQKIIIDQAKLDMDSTDKLADNVREDEKLQHLMDVDEAKLTLEAHDQAQKAEQAGDERRERMGALKRGRMEGSGQGIRGR